MYSRLPVVPSSRRMMLQARQISLPRLARFTVVPIPVTVERLSMLSNTRRCTPWVVVPTGVPRACSGERPRGPVARASRPRRVCPLTTPRSAL